MSQKSRPAPRRKQNPSVTTAIDPNVCISKQASSSKVVKELPEVDDFFMRNKRPDAFMQDLKEREQAEKQSAKLKPVHVVTSDEEDEDDGIHSSGGKRRRKKAGFAAPLGIKLPEWTKSTKSAKLQMEDSDSDIQIISEPDSDSPRIKRARSTTNEPRGRPNERSRKKWTPSPSVSPPPELTNEDLEPTRNLLRSTFPIPQRAPSPTFDETSFDTSMDQLDPELAAIAERAKSACKGPSGVRSTVDDMAGSPEIVAVTITYHHDARANPLSRVNGKQSWTYQVKRHESFNDAFQRAANSVGIPLRNLVFIRDGDHRIYFHVSPHFLKAWSSVGLDMYHQATWAKILNDRAAGSPSKRDGDTSFSSSRPNGSVPTRPGAPVSADAESSLGTSDDLIKIYIQGSAGKWLVGARPTTMASVLIGFYLRKAGVDMTEEQWKTKGIKLRYDGDVIGYDTPVSEMGDEGLETEDVLDIINV